jgi:hypothetical protein
MPTLTTIEVHATPTHRSGLTYQFTPKHHGAEATAAQWLPSLSLAEEFAVFDLADQHDLSDADGRLYGLRPAEGGLGTLGTWDQQVAEFPTARDGELWHGYPLYPLVEFGPKNRRGERGRPAKVVFDKMVEAGLITRGQRRRLLGGKHI